MDSIASAPAGSLLSLALDLPQQLFDIAANGRADRLWFGPTEELLGAGVVAGFGDIGAERWRAACRRWICLGASRDVPAAFLTAPSAPRGGAARLNLPEILLRRGGGRCSIVLTAFRDSQPAPALARQWGERLHALTAPAGKNAHGGEHLQSQDFPGRDEWSARVRAATRAIRANKFDKVVLARKRVVALRAPFDADALARRMARTCTDGRVVKLPSPKGSILAATPELLAVKRGDALVSHALAGTAPRFAAPEDDLRAVNDLYASVKERREHALVVQSIAGALREICDEVRHAPEPDLMRLRHLQHLWTPVSGRLRAGFDLLDAIAALHPTPAVLGWPKAPARAWLRETEERRDGLYTGVAGWIDVEGDGEAAVVLRCAEVEGKEARLWAGAGIMAESNPDAEWAETELKFSTFLDILGGADS
jgi:isochorismate synthase